MSFIFEKLSHSIWAFLSLIPLAALGAWANIYARNAGNHISTIVLFAMALLVTVPWVVIVRHSLISLSVAGALFDAVYGIAYFISFVALGQGATLIQWCGAAVTIVGIVLLSL